MTTPTRTLRPLLRPLRAALTALGCRLGWHAGPLDPPFTYARRGMLGRCRRCGRQGWWLP